MFAGFDFATLSLPAIILILVSAVTLLLSQDWRWSVAALLLQYLGAFLLVGISWSLQMASVKIIAGWISAFVLGLASLGVFTKKISYGNTSEVNASSSTTPSSTNFSGILFHILAMVTVALAIISVMPNLINRITGITFEQMLGAFILIGLGLLHLGLTTHPFRVILGLLTILTGFEIVYAAVENSTLVAGLLSGVNLGLATLGAYLIGVPTMERNE